MNEILLHLIQLAIIYWKEILAYCAFGILFAGYVQVEKMRHVFVYMFAWPIILLYSIGSLIG